MNIFPKPLPYKFILFSLLLSAIIFAVENINHRFWLNDFRVYYYAAEALLKGKQVYGLPFGLESGFYKYSPFVLFFFIPYTLLPYYIACCIHFIVVSVCFVLAVLVIRNIVTTYLIPLKTNNTNLLLVAVQVWVLLHVVRELKLGNVNIILILLLSTSLLFLLQNKLGYAGILLGIAIMFKPYLILLMLPLLLNRKLKALFSAVIVIVVSVIAPGLALGFSENITLHKQWLVAMREHSSYLYSNHTIHSLIKNHFYSGLAPTFNFLIIALVLIGYILFHWWNRKNKSVETKQLVFEFALLLAIIPNLLITDTEQFLYSLPLIIIVVSYVWISKRNYFILIFLIITILLYGGNSSDLLGKDLSATMEGNGMLGLSNLFIIGLAVYLYFKFLSPKHLSSEK